MDRRNLDISDAATLMTLLHRGKRPSTLRTLLPGWDMLQADVPSRERMETAMSILVGSGLAEVDSSWGMLPTAEGERIRRSIKGAQGMRMIPGAIGEILAGRRLDRAPLALPQPVFDAAREDYFDAPDAGQSVHKSAGHGTAGGGRTSAHPDVHVDGLA